MKFRIVALEYPDGERYMVQKRGLFIGWHTPTEFMQSPHTLYVNLYDTPKEAEEAIKKAYPKKRIVATLTLE